jgi:predicted nucleic-acid-binding protein
MKKLFTIFLYFTSEEEINKNIRGFIGSHLVREVFVFSTDPFQKQSPKIRNCKIVRTDSYFSTDTFKVINKLCKTDYLVLILNSKAVIKTGQNSLERFYQVGEYSGSGLIYSDYSEIVDGERTCRPTLEYQAGSVRNNFNFGPLIILKKEALAGAMKEVPSAKKTNFNFAGFYQVRLAISRKYPLTRIPENLYTVVQSKSMEKRENQFQYVDPKNRTAELEMEKAFTEYLKKIKALVKPVKKAVKFDKSFKTETSVVIPVLNRVNTIRDAIESVLKQKTDFSFNLIIVDNHSTDGTSELIKSLSEKNNKIIHIVPERSDLQIGGCWNDAISSQECGKFAVQLDSDDLFSNEHTLQKIVNKFYEEKCAMVIGTYKLTDFNLEEIPPGIIDHKEWTAENGLNNVLRTDGLGAPRAYYTPIVHKIKFPNVSYGEDYAVGLAISRQYKIGRIYEPIYICRRWEGNSDSFLSIEKENLNNFYKDKIRTFEIMIRRKMNLAKKL